MICNNPMRKVKCPTCGKMLKRSSNNGYIEMCKHCGGSFFVPSFKSGETKWVMGENGEDFGVIAER